jgi:prepilin-type N-terminal cleavage/methylation domain-containing protein
MAPSYQRLARPRGFTLVEVMLVVAIIGILATLGIPAFQRMSARARKAELDGILSKIELSFRNNFQSTGSYGPELISDPNPPGPPGPSASWDPNAKGWVGFPFPPEGGLHLRYKYTIGSSPSGAGRTLVLEVDGSFVGIPNWTYTETFSDGVAAAAPVQMPITL